MVCLHFEAKGALDTLDVTAVADARNWYSGRRNDSRERIQIMLDLICSDGLYKSIAPNILTARMIDDKSPEEILDTFAFLCEKNGDDNYTGILAIIEQ